MYALWLSSRGTCVPLQSGNAQKRQTQLFVHRIKMKTVHARLLEINRFNYQAPKHRLFCFFTFLLWFSSSLIVYQVTDGLRVTSSASPHPVKPIHQIYYDFMSYMCVYLCKGRETNSERKRVCLHLDLWCCIGNQYGSFKSCRSSDWYLEWSAYGLGTRAVSLTVPIWVTLSALMPVHLLFVLKWISCK